MHRRNHDHLGRRFCACGQANELVAQLNPQHQPHPANFFDSWESLELSFRVVAQRSCVCEQPILFNSLQNRQRGRAGKRSTSEGRSMSPGLQQVAEVNGPARQTLN